MRIVECFVTTQLYTTNEAFYWSENTNNFCYSYITKEVQIPLLINYYYFLISPSLLPIYTMEQKNQNRNILATIP